MTVVGPLREGGAGEGVSRRRWSRGSAEGRGVSSAAAAYWRGIVGEAAAERLTLRAKLLLEERSQPAPPWVIVRLCLHGPSELRRSWDVIRGPGDFLALEQALHKGGLAGCPKLSIVGALDALEPEELLQCLSRWLAAALARWQQPEPVLPHGGRWSGLLQPLLQRFKLGGGSPGAALSPASAADRSAALAAAIEVFVFEGKGFRVALDGGAVSGAAAPVRHAPAWALRGLDFSFARERVARMRVRPGAARTRRCDTDIAAEARELDTELALELATATPRQPRARFSGPRRRLYPALSEDFGKLLHQHQGRQPTQQASELKWRHLKSEPVPPMPTKALAPGQGEVEPVPAIAHAIKQEQEQTRESLENSMSTTSTPPTSLQSAPPPPPPQQQQQQQQQRLQLQARELLSQRSTHQRSWSLSHIGPFENMSSLSPSPAASGEQRAPAGLFARRTRHSFVASARPSTGAAQLRSQSQLQSALPQQATVAVSAATATLPVSSAEWLTPVAATAQAPPNSPAAAAPSAPHHPRCGSDASMFSAGSGLFHLRFSRSPARKASATSYSSAGLGSEMDADFNDDELSSCFDDDDSSAGRGAGTDTDTEDELTAMEAIRGAHVVSALPVALQALRERQKQRAGQLDSQQRQVHLLMQQQAAQRQQQLLLQLVQQHRLAPVPLQSPSLSQPGRGAAAAAPASVSASVKAPGSAAMLRKLRPRTTLLDGTAGWASSCRMVRSASEVENDVELTGDDAAFALFDVEVVFESGEVEALAGRHVGSGCCTPVSVPPTPGGRTLFTRATLDCTLLLLEDVASKLQHLQAAAGRTQSCS